MPKRTLIAASSGLVMVPSCESVKATSSPVSSSRPPWFMNWISSACVVKLAMVPTSFELAPALPFSWPACGANQNTARSAMRWVRRARGFG